MEDKPRSDPCFRGKQQLNGTKVAQSWIKALRCCCNVLEYMCEECTAAALLPPPPCGFTLLIPEGPCVLHSWHSDLSPSSVTYYRRLLPPHSLHSARAPRQRVRLGRTRDTFDSNSWKSRNYPDFLDFSSTSPRTRI